MAIGCYSAYLTFEIKNIAHYGNIETNFEWDSTVDSPTPIAGAGAGGGVDSSNDGVAIRLGIFAGMCILASSRLISQLN